MADKFGRSYRLTIDPVDGQDPIIIGLPLTCQFWMKRSQMASLNYLSVDIFNLSAAVRDRIFQDRFDYRDRTITLEGGYDTLSVIFKGFIFEAGSSRQGTDVITRIEARDGNFDVTTTRTFQTLSAGQTVGDILRFLIGEFPNLELGAVGDYNEVIQRPVTLNGNTYDLLREYSDGDVFIDNNRVFVMRRNEVLEGQIPVINVETGLLDTPRRDDGFLAVDMIFEPRLTIKQVVDLESLIQPVYNGQYQVVGIQHQGTISESVAGSLRTTAELFVGNNKFQILRD